ncbi:MAG: stimulus-sensing domain-containing protein [Hyphomicrobiaceae bacterium]
MAIGTDRSFEQLDTRAADAATVATPEKAKRFFEKIWYSQPLVRFISRSLKRRILVSNLIGLMILLGGLLYLSQHRSWLIEAKRESLRVQGEIIAAAIAANATMDTERLTLDPDKLPEAFNSRIPFRDDGFAALELSIRPERVTPILRRLIQPTNTRARIYARDGTLIVDTAKLLTRGDISRSATVTEDANKPARTRNWYTKIFDWMIDQDLPIYREIGTALGTSYHEVRMAISSGTSTAMLLLTEKGEQLVSMAVPIQRMKTVYGVLLLSTQPGEIDGILAKERKPVMWLALVALLATVFSSLLLARTVAGPMRRLSAAAEIVSDNVTARKELPHFPHRHDEVGQMSAAFAKMTGALYHRLEASEKFAADVAHELKNPLTAARSTAEALSYARTDDQRDKLVRQMNRDLMRLNRLITDISSASRLDAELARTSTDPVPLLAILENIVSAFSDKAADRGARLTLSLPPAADAKAFTIQGNELRIGQVVTNLVDNAISFSPAGTTITIRARREQDEIELAVDDQGGGIEEDKLETIFQRFYTYRPTEISSRGDNSGLGLNIAREIVQAHGGRVWAENIYGESRDKSGKRQRVGARFVVRLPVVRRGLWRR